MKGYALSERRLYMCITKKIFAALLLILSFLLTSCNLTIGTPSDTETDGTGTLIETEPPAETEREEDETVYRYAGNPDYPILADAYLDALPNMDFGGKTFIITSPDTTFLDPDAVRYVSDTVKKRNDAVEEKYNISITTTEADTATMIEEAKKARLAGMYYTDIMCLPISEVCVFDAEDLLMNLRSLPHLDLTKPYFNPASVEACTVGYRTLGVAGEATPASDLSCIIFNRGILGKTVSNELYTLAESGALTWDKLLEYFSASSSMEGVTSAVLAEGESYDSIFTSLGEKYISSNAGTVPSVATLRNSFDWVATYARPMISAGTSAGIPREESVKAFSEGKALFTVGKVGRLDDYRTTESRIGILPMPKRTVDEPYRSLAGEGSLVMTVPAGTTNSEMISLVLSGINAASYGYVTEQNASYLHASTLPDNRSADMFELIARGTVYDFTSAFEKTVPALAEFRDVVRGIIENGDFSAYEANVNKVNRDLTAVYPLSN